MLPSKDANFVGYTFKSLDVFNPMPSVVGKNANPYLVLKMLRSTKANI